MESDSRRITPLRVFVFGAAGLITAAVLYVGFAGTGKPDVGRHAGSVQIAGSETVRPVVAACAEEFMNRNPEADVIVQGGGSADGIAALFHGIVDIGMSSRGLTRQEQEHAVAKGMDIATLELALDGIAVVVHRSNPVDALNLEQLRKVFTGKQPNWRDLGGATAPIEVFARAAGSGTAALFGERVLRDGAYAAAVERLSTNEAIVAEVAARPGAIGYTGLGALKGAGGRVKVLALLADGAPAQAAAIAPTPEAVRAKTYPLSRALQLNTTGKSSGAVKAFLDFCSSPIGQALVQRAGYVPASAPSVNVAAQ